MVRLLLEKVKQNKTLAVFLLVVLGCLLVNLTIVVHPARLSGDGVSLVLMATAPLQEIGIPYRDYWEYKPLGILLLISS